GWARVGPPAGEGRVDRHRPGAGHGPRGRRRRSGQEGRGHRRARRVRPARHHRLLRHRLRAQRAPGAGDRRGGRGEAAPARREADPARGHPRGPLGAARLRRRRRARAALRGARVLRPGPAVEGLPAHRRPGGRGRARPGARRRGIRM
ncbi:MAG: Ribosomal silencing factor RsfA, partial [uncultured Pseudonocardia sp.]